jgi:nicotinamidase-related amidase
MKRDPKTKDPHGNVRHRASAALLLIDVINDLNFVGNEWLVRRSVALGKRIATLKRRLTARGIPSIYVNDNFGQWRSSFQEQVKHCIAEKSCGRRLVQQIQPHPDDYFVLKPKHSGFYGTALEPLLSSLQARTLILVGIAGDRCVLFTANDAYLREYQLYVPADCVLSNGPKENQQALLLMQRVLRADVRPSTRLQPRMLLR